MNQDDPEARIADLEHQLAGLAGSGDPASFVAYPVPLGFGAILKVSLLGLLLIAAVLVAIETVPQYLTAEVSVFMVGGWGVGLGFMAYWWWYMRRRFAICVTGGGLTVDRRPGEIFSLSDAKLGPWNEGFTVPFAGGGATAGRALHLCCGPNRFVLGGRDLYAGNQTRFDAPPVNKVDAWMLASDFDELVALTGRKSGLAAGEPAPLQPPPPAAAKPDRVGIWTWIGVSLFFVFCVYQGQNFIRAGAEPSYEYRVGTGTTATIEHCVSHSSRSGGYEVCDGRWTVDGVSQSGPIYFRFDEQVGTQVDVHVSGGHAYTAAAAQPVYMLIFGGCVAIASGFAALWSVWRKHKTGRWPLSGRRFKFLGQSAGPAGT